jgi:hypothetical protein
MGFLAHRQEIIAADTIRRERQLKRLSQRSRSSRGRIQRSTPALLIPLVDDLTHILLEAGKKKLH